VNGPRRRARHVHQAGAFVAPSGAGRPPRATQAVGARERERGLEVRGPDAARAARQRHVLRPSKRAFQEIIAGVPQQQRGAP